MKQRGDLALELRRLAIDTCRLQRGACSSPTAPSGRNEPSVYPEAGPAYLAIWRLG